MISMSNMMNGLFGKVANGMCRISMNGDIAIKTSQGYKTYDVEHGLYHYAMELASNRNLF